MAPGHTNGTNGSTAANGTGSPEIILYTNHTCPWAHRAHIALKELGLSYKEVIIDLDRPREPWYLKVNPRGLVPSISYNGDIVTESAIVTQFLADAHQSHLLPPSTSASDALARARVAFFVDAFISKAWPHVFAGLRSTDAAEKDAAANKFVEAILKEVEPLLEESGNKGPFFGGSERLTLAEVQTGPFLLRSLSLAKPEYELLSPKLLPLLEKVPKFKAWADLVVQEESVNFIWNEKLVAERTKAKLVKLAGKV